MHPAHALLLLLLAVVACCVLVFWQQRHKEPYTLYKGEQLITMVNGNTAGASHATPKLQLPTKMNENHTSIEATFNVKFDRNGKQDFEWLCRGKVGGLFIGPGNADGGNPSQNGASVRLMWDGYQKGGYAYVYLPVGAPRPGQMIPTSGNKGFNVFKGEFNGVFADNQWHTIKLGVKLNSFKNNVPQANGALTFAIDGKQRSISSGIIWRKFPKLVAGRFEAKVFPGGGSKEEEQQRKCTATRTSYMRIGKIQVSTR